MCGNQQSVRQKLLLGDMHQNQFRYCRQQNQPYMQGYLEELPQWLHVQIRES
jgi:hypothetical protein